MMPSVLVVDDDPGFVAHIRASREAAGMQVLEAVDGEKALALMKSESTVVEGAVVDLDLPAMSGFDLIREMTARFSPVRILAVTGIYKELYLEIARNVGARMARRKNNVDDWAALVRELLG